MKILFSIGLFLTGLLIFCSKVTAAPPEVTRDLQKGQVIRIDKSVSTMPADIQKALGKVFRQRSLFMADPGRPFRDADVIVNATVGNLPTRRLALAFGTRDFYYVYYRAGGAEDAGKLVAFKKKPRGYSFVWGGVEFEHDPNSPREIIGRIQRNSFNDTKKFFW
jgi:hypothetical protein